MTFIDCATVVGASLAGALLAELISWVLIYRTDSYKRLTAELERLQSKVDKYKEVATADTKSKKKDRFEDQIKQTNQDLTSFRLRSTIAIGIAMFSLFAVLNSTFDGVVVARLPFEPFSWIRTVSHRGISGTDYYQSSMVFVYILSSIAIRANLQRLLGTTPPPNPTPSIWGAPQ
ncbi:transmembrane and coiled-coil domains 1 [Planoprotostelium fungivorum]|uniref:Transmembrane and coiled-coil domains 1 n=1 Tax=Planoprotostelium fungivorum TaxID=1890364 RepID=A0A2P6NUI6_9EUKA|nr:transmembrane and coiled-coil domains 1 [Planoprotostelium fungivorum]